MSTTRTYKVRTNRHPATNGELWGWVETPNGDHVLFWTGTDQRRRAAERARELDRIGWINLTPEERRHV